MGDRIIPPLNMYIVEIEDIIQLLRTRELEESLAAKSTFCSYSGRGFNSHHKHDSTQPSITPISALLDQYK